MRRLRWMVGQTVPRTYWTRVGRNGADVVVIWRMWLGRSYSVLEFPVAT